MNLPLAHRKAELRLEDDALVRGAGSYVDDPRLPNQAVAVFVRSPHASARIVSIDTAKARGAKGVVAVLTDEDVKAAGLKSAGRHPPLPGRGGKELVQPDAGGRARLFRRRSGRHGGGGNAGGGARCRRLGHGRIRRDAGGHRCT
jgi:CO/xanthine dehydrogenase Mo-binding subunit